MPMQPNVIIINPDDNVAVALEEIRRDETIVLPDGTTISALSDIPYSHKAALTDIAPGESIVKYGEVIGMAKTAIRKGEWIHTHNLDIEDRKP